MVHAHCTARTAIQPTPAIFAVTVKKVFAKQPYHNAACRNDAKHVGPLPQEQRCSHIHKPSQSTFAGRRRELGLHLQCGHTLKQQGRTVLRKIGPDLRYSQARRWQNCKLHLKFATSRVSVKHETTSQCQIQQPQSFAPSGLCSVKRVQD